MSDVQHEHHAVAIHRLLCWLRNTSVLKRDHIHPRTSQVRSIFSPFLPSISQPCLVLTRFSLPRTGSAEHQPLEIDTLIVNRGQKAVRQSGQSASPYMQTVL